MVSLFVFFFPFILCCVDLSCVLSYCSRPTETPGDKSCCCCCCRWREIRRISFSFLLLSFSLLSNVGSHARGQLVDMLSLSLSYGLPMGRSARSGCYGRFLFLLLTFCFSCLSYHLSFFLFLSTSLSFQSCRSNVNYVPASRVLSVGTWRIAWGGSVSQSVR